MAKEKKKKDPKRQAAGRKSKRKGSTFERTCCKLLTAWWYPDGNYEKVSADKLPFFRSPGSGGWATKRKFHRNKNIDSMSGDIVCPNDFPFMPEMKNREDWSFDQYFKENPGFELWDWWKQTVEQAVRSGKEPLLLFTKNNNPIYYATRHSQFVMTFRLRATLLWTPVTRIYVGLLSDLTECTTKVSLMESGIKWK